MAGKLTDDRMMSASRLPGLMGYSKYSSPNDELQYSIHAIDGKERPDIGNEAMAWGNTLEPVILAEACQRLGITGDFQLDKPFAHFALPLQCSLDGLADGSGDEVFHDPDRGIYVMGQDSIKLDGPGVLEAKLTRSLPEDTPHLARGPIQLQGQMLVTGCKWGAVCVLYQGIHMRVFLFAQHYETQQAIGAAVTDFQARLDKYRKTSEIDWYEPQSSRELDKIYPVAVDPNEIPLPAEAELWAKTIVEAKTAIRHAEARIELAEMSLKQLLGQSERGRVGNVLVTWPMRNYKAQPPKMIPAKDAYSVRQSSLSVREVSE